MSEKCKHFDHHGEFIRIIESVLGLLERIDMETEKPEDIQNDTYGYRIQIRRFQRDLNVFEGEIKNKNYLDFARNNRELMKVLYLAVSDKMVEILHQMSFIVTTRRPNRLELKEKFEPEKSENVQNSNKEIASEFEVIQNNGQQSNEVPLETTFIGEDEVD